MILIIIMKTINKKLKYMSQIILKKLLLKKLKIIRKRKYNTRKLIILIVSQQVPTQ
jgi:hypothetical protein